MMLQHVHCSNDRVCEILKINVSDLRHELQKNVRIAQCVALNA